MAKYGPKKINPGAGTLTRHKGKGGSNEVLPSRHALAQLTHGDPWQRSMGNYAKLTPSGAAAPGTYQDIVEMAAVGPRVK